MAQQRRSSSSNVPIIAQQITFLRLLFGNIKKTAIFATDLNIAIMEVAINSQLYQQASVYAQQHGLNITSVIENFLRRFIGHQKEATEQAIPDIVLSLLGAGESVAEDDLNAREAYQQYLEEKYK